jgi:hypothetical protein
MFTHTTTTGTVALVDHGSALRDEVRRALAGFLAGYSGTTVDAYRLDLRQWITWLDSFHTDVFAVERAHIELYARLAEADDSSSSTRPPMYDDPNSTTNPPPWVWTATNSEPSWSKPAYQEAEITPWRVSLR